MMTGEAKVAITSVDLSNSPNPGSALSAVMNQSPLSESSSSSSTMISTEVAKIGMGSRIQQRAASTKIATTRCSMTVIPSSGIQWVGISRMVRLSSSGRIILLLMGTIVSRIGSKKPIVA